MITPTRLCLRVRVACFVRNQSPGAHPVNSDMSHTLKEILRSPKKLRILVPCGLRQQLWRPRYKAK
jgi:hypothetical protein